MSISNLSIVFGPTLLGAPPEEGGLNLEHMSFQCKVSLPYRFTRSSCCLVQQMAELLSRSASRFKE
jgi:hypothetical protein